MGNDKRLDDIIIFLADVVKIKELEQRLRTEDNRKEVMAMSRNAYLAIYPTYAPQLQETPERIYLSYLAGLKPIKRTYWRTVGTELDFLKEVIDIKIVEDLGTEDKQKAYLRLCDKYGSLLQKTCERKYLNYLAGEPLPATQFISAQGEELEKKLSIWVDELNLTIRSSNCLQNAGIEHIWQLVTREEWELLRIKNFGRKSFFEITEILAEMGLTLGMSFYAPEDQTDSF